MIYYNKLKFNKCSTFVSQLLMILFLSATATLANDAKVNNNDYSIVIPQGWTAISKNALEVYSKRLTKLYPHLPGPKYDFGFKLKRSQEPFDYPFVLVQSEKTGAMPEKLLDAYEKYSSKKFPEMSKLEPGVWVYDEDEAILWMYTESRIIDVGPVSNLVGVKLTKKGYVQVNCTSIRSDFKKFEPVFVSITRSISPNAELVYNNKSFLSEIKKVQSNWIVIGLFIIITLTGVAAIFFNKYILRKNK